jgi:hypothetical protein
MRQEIENYTVAYFDAPGSPEIEQRVGIGPAKRRRDNALVGKDDGQFVRSGVGRGGGTVPEHVPEVARKGLAVAA